jgi:membrane protease YdiL (CAAX protease family)
MGTIPALTASSLLFASIHMNILHFPGLLLLGAVLQLLYIHFKSLYPCILLHILQNSVSLLILLLAKFFNLIPPA